MQRFSIVTADGVGRNVEVYNNLDFPYKDFRFINTLSSRNKTVVNVVCTFDIETTTIDRRSTGGKVEGFMYHWQFCINGVVVFGRTWDEFLLFMSELEKSMLFSPKKHLVVYVHNLSFEFQFLYRFFEWESVFAKDKRQVLKAVTSNGIEFRCSYYLTNKSLAKFCEQSKSCVFRKLDGEIFDYSKIRTPITPMSVYELGYCYCDVRGLWEALLDLLERDNLLTIPMTSTGYVRRDCRNAMKKNKDNRKMFLKTALSKEVYELLEEEKRGGNTHANRAIVGIILHNVLSLDYASSYPYQMMTQYFPMSSFTPLSNVLRETFYGMIETKCCLFRAIFKNIRIKNNVPVPYIAHSKCRHYTKNDIVFNGRVLESPAVEITLNEIDFDIIQKQYTWDAFAVSDFWFCERGELPQELKEQIVDYYIKKTNLKGVDAYLYIKSKNELNAIFGMACTDPVHDVITIDDGEWNITKSDVQSELDKYYKSRNSFLPIQWGNWVTAHARKWLQEMLDISNDCTAYTDTDSDKMQSIDIHKFDKLVKKAVELDEKNGAYADRDGKRYYMGIPDFDGEYLEFKTWGAKKYAYIEKDKEGIPRLHITVAGVHKSKGVKTLIRQARIEAKRRGIKRCPDTNHIALELFESGFTWQGAENGGGTESHWNDDPIHYITVKGCKIKTAGNVGVLDSSYTLGLTEEFLENMNFGIDISIEV